MFWILGSKLAKCSKFPPADLAASSFRPQGITVAPSGTRFRAEHSCLMLFGPILSSWIQKIPKPKILWSKTAKLKFLSPFCVDCDENGTFSDQNRPIRLSATGGPGPSRPPAPSCRALLGAWRRPPAPAAQRSRHPVRHPRHPVHAFVTLFTLSSPCSPCDRGSAVGLSCLAYPLRQ